MPTTMARKGINLFNFAAGEFWDEEAFFLELRLAKMVGEAEAKRVMQEETWVEQTENRNHPYAIMASEAAFPIIKRAYDEISYEAVAE